MENNQFVKKVIKLGRSKIIIIPYKIVKQFDIKTDDILNVKIEKVNIK